MQTPIFLAGDTGQARRILDAVIAALPAGPTRARGIASSWGWSSSPTTVSLKQRDYFEDAATESGTDIGLRVLILISLAYALLNAGQYDRAYDRVQQAVTDAERLGAAPRPGPALGMRAMMDFMGGKGFDEPAVQRAVELQGPRSLVPLPQRPGVQMSLLRAWTGELGESPPGAPGGRTAIPRSRRGGGADVHRLSPRAHRHLAWRPAPARLLWRTPRWNGQPS